MNVVGVDPALRYTGIAHADGTTDLYMSGHRKGMNRVAAIRDRVFEATRHADLVAIEGYAYATAHSAHVLGELGGVIRLGLHDAGIAYTEIPPSVLKKYATGTGNANKITVVAAARDLLGYDGYNDNVADALWLRAIALDLMDEPLPGIPAKNRHALDRMRSLI